MEVVTHRILRIIYPRQGRIHKEIGKGDYKGICEKVRTGDHMITDLQCDLFNFKNMKGRYPNRLRQEYNILMITIWRVSLDAFWIQEPGTVRVTITIMVNMGIMNKEELVL